MTVKQPKMIVQLAVNIFKEGKRFIADCPAISLCSHGSTVSKAQKNFDQAFKIWFKSVDERGMLLKALAELGWTMKPIPTPKETFYEDVHMDHLVQKYHSLQVPVGHVH
jgi:predicted RNase H-like HicB family nuclease